MRLPGRNLSFPYIFVLSKDFIHSDKLQSVHFLHLCTPVLPVHISLSHMDSVYGIYIRRRIRRRRKISAQNDTISLSCRIGTGIADISAFVYGCSGLSKISFLSAISTIFPRYITATRLLMYSTTDKSCEMKM